MWVSGIDIATFGLTLVLHRGTSKFNLKYVSICGIKTGIEGISWYLRGNKQHLKHSLALEIGLFGM